MRARPVIGGYDADMVDVVVIGGGPAGLAAALVLGRSRKHVVVCDGGTPRNAAATYIAGFITQDRISPTRFRHVAHEDLQTYPTVEVHVNTLVTRIERARGGFRVHAGGTEVETRRVLLCCGIHDEPLPLEGSRELWGASLFECPYCHGWEIRDRSLGFLSPSAEHAGWVRLLRSWSSNVMLFTNGAYALSAELRGELTAASLPIEERRIVGLERQGKRLTAIVVDGDVRLPREALFFRPIQRQTPIVSALAVALDGKGYVKVDEEYRTSIPGIHAAGDLITHYHGALAAASSGSMAAHCINHQLTLEQVGAGVL
jgi:thioredoxin reductase